jgi:hypothetical protein
MEHIAQSTADNAVTRASTALAPQLSHCFSSTMTAFAARCPSLPITMQSRRRDDSGSWYSSSTP